jgi:sarcosine oxidase
MHGSEGDQSYGFPIPPGSQGLKVATEIYERTLRVPEDIDRTVAAAETQRIYDTHVAGRLSGVASRCLKAKTCLYTLAPDSRFVIDAHPENDRLTLVSACSGHGFKHSAAIGEAVAEKILDGRSRIDLSDFATPARVKAA